MTDPQAAPLGRLRSYRSLARPYAVYAYIWGLQWTISAVLTFFGQWNDLRLADDLVLIAAVIATILFAITGKRTLTSAAASAVMPAAPLICAIMVIAAVRILESLHAVDPFFIPLFNGFILAAAYAGLGSWLGKPLMLMGFWLFILCTVTGVWFLGFAPLLVEGLGGLSMIALGWIIGMWSRGQ
jgi:hypothetical protein